MENKLEKARKLAVNLFSCGKSISEICKITGFSKIWFYKWYKRFLSKDKEWFKNHSKSPHNIPHKTKSEVENNVIYVRKKLEKSNMPKGAQAIYWEMKDLNYAEVPPISTINAILKRNNLIEPKQRRYEPKGKIYPSIEPETPTVLQQVDFLGPRYLQGGFRFYSLNVMDIFSHTVGLEPSESRHDMIVVHSLTSIWKRMGIPKYLQMDNQLPFRGSNRYPRSFGIVLKLCLSLDIEPIFIPINEPWRNGCIEKFEDTFQKYFLKKYHFNDFKHLLEETKMFEKRHNSEFRYSFLKGKTPNEVLFENNWKINYLPQNYQFDPAVKIKNGLIHFVRFIRSDRILDIFGEKFSVPKKVMYEYVWATIDVKQQKLKLFLDHKQVEEYKYRLPNS